MKRILLFLLIILCVACSPTSPSSEPTIVLVAPLPHKAMEEIAAGFKENLNLPQVQVKIVNAQGDPNLMRTIFQQLQQQKVAVVLPIGTSATQMAHLMLPDTRVIGLAANVVPDQKQARDCTFSVIDDEIDRKKQIEFIRAVYPDINQLVLLHSSDDKVYAEITDFSREAERAGIQVKALLVNNLMELPNVLSQLPASTQGLFILKDHLLVSAIPTLKQYSAEHHLHLITSDEGSIAEGGDMALGVREKDIGRAGAALVKKVFETKQSCMAERIVLDRLTVFINSSLPSLEQKKVREAAERLHYSLHVLGQ